MVLKLCLMRTVARVRDIILLTKFRTAAQMQWEGLENGEAQA